MDRFARAQSALDTSDNLIKEEANATSGSKKTRERTRKILNGIQQVIAVVEGAAELHPAAKTAVTIFKALIKLEVDRRENSEQIVVVYHNLTHAMYSMRHISSSVAEDEALSEQIHEVMGGLTTDMEAFGVFADVYYKNSKSRIVRFLRSGDFNAKLQEFSHSFINYQNNIAMVLDARDTVNVQIILSNTQRILQRLGVPTSQAERNAAAQVQRLGGVTAVCEDRALVHNVAQTLSAGAGDRDPITATTLEVLTTDIDSMMEKDRPSFEAKLDGAKEEILELIARSTSEIMKVLTDGPHDLLVDEDVKAIWKANQWKMSVKVRLFVDSLYTHFEEQYRGKLSAGEDVDDEWTLKVLAKVINHPAIGEAIDEDASGFLSLHEVNHFLKRKPEGWTTPMWFVFWGVGWRYLNGLYTLAIQEFLQELENSCNTLREALTAAGAKSQSFDDTVADFLETIEKLWRVTDWLYYTDGSDEDEILADLDDTTSSRVKGVSEALSEVYEQRMITQLELYEFKLDDMALLPSIVKQSDVRIEQFFLSLVYVILRRDAETIRNVAGNIVENVDEITAQIRSIDLTLFELLFALHERMRSLLRSWRAQKQDTELQIECYAGGLLYGWYKKTQEAPGDVKLFFYGSPDDNQGPQKNSSVSASVTLLTKRVNAVDDRLAKLEAMISQLLAISSSSSNQGVTQSNIAREISSNVGGGQDDDGEGNGDASGNTGDGDGGGDGDRGEGGDGDGDGDGNVDRDRDGSGDGDGDNGDGDGEW